MTSSSSVGRISTLISGNCSTTTDEVGGGGSMTASSSIVRRNVPVIVANGGCDESAADASKSTLSCQWTGENGAPLREKRRAKGAVCREKGAGRRAKGKGQREKIGEERRRDGPLRWLAV